MFDEDLQSARRRAERTISEDAFFDSRGARIPKSAVAAATTIDDDIDEEVSACLVVWREYQNKLMTCEWQKKSR